MKCGICLRDCTLRDQQIGFCGGYQNQDGSLVNIAYGRIALVQRESVSRIPLAFWSERKEALAFATHGCVLRCTYCFNSRYAHKRPTKDQLEAVTFRNPESLVNRAMADCLALTTDFVEPSNIFHFVLDVFKLAKESGVPTILSSAGTLTDQSLRSLLEYCSVVRLDVKSATLEGLQSNTVEMPGFTPERPLAVAALAKCYGCFVEFTYPLIPGLNDSESDLLWVGLQAQNLDIPVAVIGHQKRSAIDQWPSATEGDIERAIILLNRSCRARKAGV